MQINEKASAQITRRLHGLSVGVFMVRLGSPVIQKALNLSTAFGIVLIGGGVWLVYLGATGVTDIKLFGNSFTSTNVGVVGIFCGAVLVGLIFRRSLKSLDHLADVDRATGGMEDRIISKQRDSDD